MCYKKLIAPYFFQIIFQLISKGGLFVIFSLMTLKWVQASGKNLDNPNFLSVQFLVNQLKTNDLNQGVFGSYNRLSMNYEKKYNQELVFKVELEQFQNQAARNLEVNQFYLESLYLTGTSHWLWGFGYMPIPITKINILDDQLFLSSPLFQQDLFTFNRQMIESGGYLGYQTKGLMLRFGMFQRLNAGSAIVGPRFSTVPPHFVQIKILMDSLEWGVTYFAEKDAGLPQANSIGLSVYEQGEMVNLDMELWGQERIFNSQTVEITLGGYCYAGYLLQAKQLELGWRIDFLTRPSLRDAWGAEVKNLKYNSVGVIKWSILKELFLQFEHIQERQQVAETQSVGLSGSVLQLSYSVQF